MCLGIPMQVVEVREGMAVCEGMESGLSMLSGLMGGRTRKAG